MGRNNAETSELAEYLDSGELILRYRQLAMDNRVWLSLGGFPERDEHEPNKRYCSHIILNDEGSIVGNYRKMHVPDSVRPDEDYTTQIITEHKDVLSGAELHKPINSPLGFLALSVSYDLRFPEMFR